eukprot:9421908-Pyramimonas_sp.AAC.1
MFHPSPRVQTPKHTSCALCICGRAHAQLKIAVSFLPARTWGSFHGGVLNFQSQTLVDPDSQGVLTA